MQLQLSFSVLLSTLLVVLSTTGDVESHPFKRQPVGGMVTLPLKRIVQRDDIHPQVLLQQHINRGHRRLARMTGREEPTTLELRDKLAKRMFILESGPTSRRAHSHTKRFNRQGFKHPVSAQSDFREDDDKAKNHFNENGKWVMFTMHASPKKLNELPGIIKPHAGQTAGQSASGTDLDPNGNLFSTILLPTLKSDHSTRSCLSYSARHLICRCIWC